MDIDERPHVYGYEMSDAGDQLIIEMEHKTALTLFDVLNSSINTTGAIPTPSEYCDMMDIGLDLPHGGFKARLEVLRDCGVLLETTDPELFVVSRSFAKHPDFVAYPPTKL